MNITIPAGPKRVDSSAIERELQALRIAMPPVAATDCAAMTMQAVVANLIAARDTAAELDGAMEVIAEVIGADPCRIILVAAEPDADPPDLTAEVAVICRHSEICRRCVYCDQIRLAGRGILADSLPSLTATLLIPDLPTLLWWPKPPFDRKDFSSLAAQVNRVLVDSAAYAQADLRRLIGLISQTRRTETAVSDLNWARLTPYRQVFAQFFDSQECQTHLAAIHSIRIEAAPAAGRLLAGWLQTQLDKSGYRLPREKIGLVPTADKLVFQALAMTCAGGKNSFTVTRRDAGAIEACAVIAGQTQSRLVKATPPGDAQLLAEELKYAGRDTVFETALTAAAEL